MSMMKLEPRIPDKDAKAPAITREARKDWKSSSCVRVAPHIEQPKAPRTVQKSIELLPKMYTSGARINGASAKPPTCADAYIPGQQS